MLLFVAEKAIDVVRPVTVCMKSQIGWVPFGAEIVRLIALTMPALMDSEYSSLSGVPIATTVWPGTTEDESPSVSG